MIFHIRITFSGFDSNPEKSSIAIGDTILVKSTGEPENKFLTSNIPKKWSHISYTLDDSEEEEEKQEVPKSSHSNGHEKKASTIQNNNIV